jgi:hypothetical protein
MIQAFIDQKFPGNNPNRVAWRREVVHACTSFVETGLADPKFFDELLSGEEHKFWSCLSEALVAQRLIAKKFPPRPNSGVGPDFLVMDGERKVWIEVVCPEPVQLPKEWLDIQPNIVVNFPHEEILLRWTSAIKVKAERLLGSDRRPEGYLASGIVSKEDAYVIAVNSCRLRHGPFPSLMGISQFPFAAEAAFGFGPFQITINKDTLESVDTGYQHRPFVKNRNGANVPAHTFLDPAFEPISAIWAVDLNGYSAFGGSEPMYVVHNPNATCPVSEGFLPSSHDYVARQEDEHFVLDRPKEENS